MGLLVYLLSIPVLYHVQSLFLGHFLYSLLVTLTLSTQQLVTLLYSGTVFHYLLDPTLQYLDSLLCIVKSVFGLLSYNSLLLRIDLLLLHFVGLLFLEVLVLHHLVLLLLLDYLFLLLDLETGLF